MMEEKQGFFCTWVELATSVPGQGAVSRMSSLVSREKKVKGGCGRAGTRVR